MAKKFMIRSEDGIDLYEGDDYFRAGRSKPDATGEFKLFEGKNLKEGHFVCSYPETDKAFFSREAAQEFIDKQNRPI